MSPVHDGDGGLVLDAVSKRFRRGHWVLDGVELAIRRQSVTLVVGANGSGKSTLLRIATGLTRPTAGHITGRPSSVVFAPERLPAQLRFTARQYVAHMGRMRGLDDPDASTRAGELFERLALAPGPDVAIRTLSKGNSQKVALAQAFLAPAALLVLDEPFSGLDTASRRAVSELIAERRNGGAGVLVSSHDEIPDTRPDQAFELLHGRLQALDPGSERLARVVLSGVGDVTGSWLEAVAGPRVTNDGPGGRHLVLTIGQAVVDATLARALADGWSVVSVNPIEADP